MNESTRPMKTLEVICVNCKKTHHITVPVEGYEAWRTGKALIQNALPELSADKRELLLSGFCPQCWDHMFTPLKAKEADAREADIQKLIDLFELAAGEGHNIEGAVDRIYFAVWLYDRGVKVTTGGED